MHCSKSLVTYLIKGLCGEWTQRGWLVTCSDVDAQLDKAVIAYDSKQKIGS